jgi:hypothetical protein
MIPPKHGDLWTPTIQITIEKVTWHAILDLESSVYAISKELYHQLEIGAMGTVILLSYLVILLRFYQSCFR